MTLDGLEQAMEAHLATVGLPSDPAHDLLHFKRVVKMAKAIGAAEGADLDIVIPAAWLHDLIAIPKDDPRRSNASRLSARAAVEFLSGAGYPSQRLDAVAHAVEAHSFSAGIEPRTLEARVVQDADRLDGLGAIGIARCFATAGSMGRVFYEEGDPFCEQRAPDDGRYTIDHFYRKLFKTAKTLRTAVGREEGVRRAALMRQYLADLRAEL
jgi:uncharacterized protein